MPGPVPKRSDQRRRRNEPEIPIDTAAAPVERYACPPASDEWHPMAKDWYDSLAESGQAAFYQPSDWQVARLVAEGLHKMLSAKVFSAMAFKEVMAAMGNLLVTEGDRRRLRIELERVKPVDPDEVASVTVLSDWQSRLSG